MFLVSVSAVRVQVGTMSLRVSQVFWPAVDKSTVASIALDEAPGLAPLNKVSPTRWNPGSIGRVSPSEKLAVLLSFHVSSVTLQASVAHEVPVVF